MSRIGRPKGWKNPFSKNVRSKSICLPQEYWDILEQKALHENISVQRLASRILTDACSSDVVSGTAKYALKEETGIDR